MVKFIQTSDWQIGMKGGGLGDAGALVRRQRINSISRIFELALEHDVDFVFIAGDVFENNNVSDQDVSAVISILNKHPNLPVYLLPGNHDCLGSGCVYDRDIFNRVEHLTILNSFEPIEIGDAILHPLPLFSRYSSEGDHSFLDVKEQPGIHIGVSHGSLIGKVRVGGDLEYPIDLGCIEECGLDYLALGHWHSWSIHEDSAGVPRVAYSGTHEQTKYSEKDAGYCLLVEISEKGAIPVIKPLKCGGLSWASFDYEISSGEQLSHLDGLLKEHKDHNMLELNLRGRLSLDDENELKRILAYHDTLHEDFRTNIDSLRYTVPIDKDSARDLGDPTLNLVDVELRSMILDEADPRQQAVLVEAISMLYRLSEEGS